MSKQSLIQKLDRATATGWSRAMPKWCGPCTWLKTPRKERRDILANLRRIQSGSAWVSVVPVKEDV